MDSSVSPKDKIWFLRVCHHISNAVYHSSLWLQPVFLVLAQRLCVLPSVLQNALGGGRRRRRRRNNWPVIGRQFGDIKLINFNVTDVSVLHDRILLLTWVCEKERKELRLSETMKINAKLNVCVVCVWTLISNAIGARKGTCGPVREEITGDWRKLHDKELLWFYTIRQILRW
jgi:hypothetical protein